MFSWLYTLIQCFLNGFRKKPSNLFDLVVTQIHLHSLTLRHIKTTSESSWHHNKQCPDPTFGSPWTFSGLKNLNTPKKNFTSSLQSRLLPRRTQSTITFDFFLVDLMDSWYCPTWLQKSLVWRTRTSLMFMSADPAILARELWMTEKSRREIVSEECDALLKLVKLNC